MNKNSMQYLHKVTFSNKNYYLHIFNDKRLLLLTDFMFLQKRYSYFIMQSEHYRKNDILSLNNNNVFKFIVLTFILFCFEPL